MAEKWYLFSNMRLFSNFSKQKSRNCITKQCLANFHVISITKKSFSNLHSSRISRLRWRHSGFDADICCILSYPPNHCLNFGLKNCQTKPLTRISAALVKIEFGMPLPVVASMASGKWRERITPFKSVVSCRTRSISPSTFFETDDKNQIIILKDLLK